MRIIFGGIALGLFELSLAGIVSAAPVETVLYNFAGGTDGANPFAGLIADSKGNLYGAAEFGGALGSGVVFELSPPVASGGAWAETVLHSFSGPLSDGSFPQSSPIAAGNGHLYGTTVLGGAFGSGAVYELAPPTVSGGAWTETVVHSFAGGDGADPYAGLIADSKGNLYGTTFYGGASASGVVYELSPPAASGGAWTETVLYAFTGGDDGGNPFAALIADSKGNLYGTTYEGGAAGAGVIFELSPPASSGGTWTETVLYTFTGGSDGGFPHAGLFADGKGNLYGTTINGGAPSDFGGDGVVFELSPPATVSGAWSETVLHEFSGGADGSFPSSVLFADSKGNLFGTTINGGSTDAGVVFELSPPTATGGSWTETVLHTFANGSDGSNPHAGVFADSKGNLYGTAFHGGTASSGMVFELTGTGFVTNVPFAAFSSDLDIQFGRRHGTDAFELLSAFTLGSTSSGINPLTDPVTLTIGTFTATLPPGSFRGRGHGPYTFTGTIKGAKLEAAITQTGDKRFEFAAAAQDAHLTGTTNPVSVTLTIGSNSGTDFIRCPDRGW